MTPLHESEFDWPEDNDEEPGDEDDKRNSQSHG